MDLISIIIPVYNVEDYLDACVFSVINQIYKHLEIILIDDGSSDNSSEMCEKWALKDDRIKVIHKKNGGLSDARNAGLKIFKGKYVSFVDSDDILDIHFIEWLYKAICIKKVKMSACDLKCFFEETDIKSNKKECNITVYTSLESLEQVMAGKKIRAIACNKLYDRELIQNVQFVYGKHHEDEFFTYNIIHKAQQVAYVDEQLYYYRQRPGSIMSSFSMKRLDALEAYLERQSLFKTDYPTLYIRDKVSFCVSCISYYRLALENQNIDIIDFKSRIKKLRGKVKFTFTELLKCSLKDLIYIFMSGNCIDFFCKILNKIRGDYNG